MERRRETRLSIELPGSYATEGARLRGMFFSQISSKGCRIAARDLALPVGTQVELNLGAIGPIAGVVRWAAPESAGIEFHVALEAAIVGYFAAFIDDVA